MTLESGSVFRSQWQRYLRVLNGVARSSLTGLFNNLHTLWGSILAQNLAPPKPYTIYAPETKTTDPIEKTHKKMSDSRRGKKNGNSTPSPPGIRINLKKEQTMKKWVYTAVWVVVAVAGAIITHTNPLW